MTKERKRAVHTLMWTFKVPVGTSKDQLLETIAAMAHTYESPGIDPQILWDNARWWLTCGG